MNKKYSGLENALNNALGEVIKKDEEKELKKILLKSLDNIKLSKEESLE